jgi:hypothetical protein
VTVTPRRTIDDRSAACATLDLERVVSRGREALIAANEHGSLGWSGTFNLSFWDPASSTPHPQLFEDGRFCGWIVGEPPLDALTFVATPKETARMLCGAADGQRTFDRLRVRMGGADDGPIPPPPLDPATSEALRTAQPLPGVSSTAALRFEDTPFGCLDVTIAVIEGRPVISLGEASSPDVSANLRFATVLRYLAGDVGFMEMLHGGNIEGEWPQLMLVAGVIESHDFQRAVEPMRPAYRHLADAVELLGTDWYRQAMRSAYATMVDD